MDCGLLIAAGPLAGIAALFLNLFICGFVQELHKLRGKTIPDTNNLFVILTIPLWITIWCIFYYAFKLFIK